MEFPALNKCRFKADVFWVRWDFEPFKGSEHDRPYVSHFLTRRRFVSHAVYLMQV